MIDRNLMTLFGGEPDLRLVPDQPVEFRGIAPLGTVGTAPELCQLCDRWSTEVHPEDAIMDVKLDGRRSLYLGGPLISREGYAMEQAAHSHRALTELESLYGKPMFFDGEYVHPEGLDACSRAGGTIWLFDAVPLEVWRREGPTAPLIERRRQLLALGEKCFGPALGAIRPKLVRNAAEVEAHRLFLEDQGYEGGVVKLAKGQYRRRRGEWWKVKHWKVIHGRVVDVMGSDRQGATSFLVSYQGVSQKIVLACPKAQRDVYWATRASLTGRVVQIEHAGLTSRGLLRDSVLIGLEEASNG